MAEEAAAGLDVEENGPKPEESPRAARPDTNIREEDVTAEQNTDEVAEDDLSNPRATLDDEQQQELTDEERVQLYEKAMKFKTKHSYKHALLCFLGCIKGIQQNTKFSFLPNCLQNIASIYAKFEDFSKAVQFMQAAKMYYENALIGSQPNDEDNDYKTMDENATDEQAKRANEYEKLSHDCLLEQNVPLALEYCGKATQIRRKFYGENHPVTVKSLDLFTMIYAEMGKMQYSEAIGKFDKDQVEVKEENEEKKTSGKKVRFKDEIDEMTSKDEHDDVEETNKTDDTSKFDEQQQQQSRFFTSKQLLLVFILSSLLAIIITSVWCTYTENEACPSYKYIYERAKFNYYYYIKSWLTEKQYI